jgi:hypothetical protein
MTATAGSPFLLHSPLLPPRPRLPALSVLPILAMLALAVFGCATAKSPREVRADECRDEVGRKLGYRYDASARVWRSTFGAAPTAPGVPIPGLYEALSECFYRPRESDAAPWLSGRVTFIDGRSVALWVWSDGPSTEPLTKGAYRSGAGESGEVEVYRERNEYRAKFGAGAGRRACTAVGRIEGARWTGVYTCEAPGRGGTFEAFERRL